MSRYVRRISYFMLLIVFSVMSLSGQATKKNLEEERKNLQKEIASAEKLLSSTTAKKKASLSEIKILNRKVENREAIIRNIEQQISLAEQTINQTQSDIDSLEVELVELKKEYAKLIRNSYKTQSQFNRLIFLFSANSFNDAYKRVKYMQYYNDYRKKQVRLIDAAKIEKLNKIDQLIIEKDLKKELLTSQKAEQEKLKLEKSEKDAMAKELRKQEKKIESQINDKKKAMEELTKQIQNIIERELRAEAQQQKITKAPSAKVSALSGNFKKNKGKLPWPVKDGVITGKFGRNKHPLLKYVTTNNNGIDISTSKDASVRTIFDGEVRDIFFNPTFQNAVIVKHGAYFSVYTNLKEVFVQKGEQVKTQTPIGLAYTDDKKKTEVHLEVWKGNAKLDPSKWIKK